MALYINTVKHGWNGLKSELAIFEKLIGNCELCSQKHLAKHCFLNIVTLIVKMNCNRTDFAVGADSHVRTPDPGPGSDNVVHSSFSKVATGIFPE